MEQWLPAIFGLAGVTLGVVLGSAFELWRRALDGQAAARVLRMETIANRTKVEILLQGKPIRTPPESSAWQELRTQVAPFLDELRLSRLAQSYNDMQDIGLHKPDRMHFYILVPQDKKWVSEWFERFEGQTPWLRSIEASNPWRLVWRLLWGQRIATQDEIREEFGIADEEFQEYQTERKARAAALAAKDDSGAESLPTDVA